MIRINKKYSIKKVLKWAQENQNINDPKKRVMFDNDNIKPYSLRYQVFNKSVICSHCGLKAQYFYKEKTDDTTYNYHLNMYGLNPFGIEVLFTKDRIIPKSNNGTDSIDNLQTLCTLCNNRKYMLQQNFNDKKIINGVEFDIEYYKRTLFTQSQYNPEKEIFYVPDFNRIILSSSLKHAEKRYQKHKIIHINEFFNMFPKFKELLND